MVTVGAQKQVTKPVDAALHHQEPGVVDTRRDLDGARGGCFRPLVQDDGRGRFPVVLRWTCLRGRPVSASGLQDVHQLLESPLSKPASLAHARAYRVCERNENGLQFLSHLVAAKGYDDLVSYALACLRRPYFAKAPHGIREIVLRDIPPKEQRFAGVRAIAIHN